MHFDNRFTMSTPSESKLAQFDEFFTIEYDFNVNIAPIDNNQIVSYESFLARMPMPFKMANDIVNLDQTALRPLQTLGSIAGQLVDYLQHQSQKIDLLVSYILSEQDEVKKRQQGKSFGGGGLTFSSNDSYQVGDLVEIKFFLNSENCVVYCYGEIIAASPTEENTKNYKAIYHFIRDEDRELLVRTSLHLQSKQLQLLAKQRNNSVKE